MFKDWHDREARKARERERLEAVSNPDMRGPLMRRLLDVVGRPVPILDVVFHTFYLGAIAGMLAADFAPEGYRDFTDWLSKIAGRPLPLDNPSRYMTLLVLTFFLFWLKKYAEQQRAALKREGLLPG